jgi:hypothetical protein
VGPYYCPEVEIEVYHHPVLFVYLTDARFELNGEKFHKIDPKIGRYKTYLRHGIYF